MKTPGPRVFFIAALAALVMGYYEATAILAVLGVTDIILAARQ